MYRVSVWGEGKVREMGSGDSYMTMEKYLIPLICTHKIGSNDKFYVI